MRVGKFKVLIFCGCLAMNAGARENVFPEIDQRKEWDRGCEDWPETYNKSGREANPSFQVEKGSRDFRFRGRLRIPRLLGESPEQLKNSLISIVENFPGYPDWILPGINAHPEGRSYFVELSDLHTHVLSKESFDLTGPFLFHLLWIKKTGRTTIQNRLQEEMVPDCPSFAEFKGKPQKVLRFRMIPRPDLLDWMIGEIWVLPGSLSGELRARAVIRPAKTIFELMPETLMQSEVQYRGERVLENFLVFRRNKALKK
jgi:hypothetical protein